MASLTSLAPLLISTGAGVLQDRMAQQDAADRERARFARQTAREDELWRRRLKASEEIADMPVDPDPKLVAERTRTLQEREEARQARTVELEEAQGAQRARAASRGIAGSGSARAIQRNLLARGAEDAAAEETRFQLRLDDIDRRQRQNLLETTERRRRAILGLDGQFETRGGF